MDRPISKKKDNIWIIIVFELELRIEERMYKQGFFGLETY